MTKLLGIRMIVLFIILLSVTIPSNAKGKIYLKDCGIEQANSDVARFEILSEAHAKAMQEGKTVSYSGIDSLFLEIPHGAKSIKLSGSVDFGNTVFVVKNNYKDFVLFIMAGTSNVIEVNKQEIDRGYYNDRVLKRGSNILVISDKNVWSERIGHSNAAYRKDVVCIKKGRALSTVCSPYDNAQPNPECMYFPAAKKRTTISNLHFVRSSESSKQTFLLQIKYMNNVLLDNLTIKTPDSDLYGDRAIWIENCYDVRLQNIVIDGTYSLSNKYGYGIQLENVTRFYADGIVARGKWGIFGTNNVNTSYLKNCDINRFDIHCYGKDVVMEDCTIRDLYNQFSGVYGTIKFKRCHFVNATPYVDGGSYNTNVEHNIVIEDCTMECSNKKNYIVCLHNVRSEVNSRDVLNEKYLPNITIRNLTVDMPDEGIGIQVFNILNANYMGELNGGSISTTRIKHKDSGRDVKVESCNRQLKIKSK